MTYRFKIDIAKMKRWHGTPPLLNGEDESHFDEFIVSLADCVRSGDALAESLVYRYGIERWRMGQLLFQREKLSLVHHYLIVEFNRRDDERRNHREHRKDTAADRADLVKEIGTCDVVFTTIFGEDLIADIRRTMHYAEDFKLDEMAAAREFEFMIAQYQRLERAMNECETQTANILKQMAIHRVTIEEREERDTVDAFSAAIDGIIEAQERETAEKLAVRSKPLTV
jgi:hypothetical protein